MKYELTERRKIINGSLTYQIQALKSFGDVEQGEHGGFIRSEANLSQEGNCWVYDDASVTGDAQIRDKAKIKDNAQVMDNAVVSGRAIVSGFSLVYDEAVIKDSAHVSSWAKVFESAIVCDRAQVAEDARVYGHAKITQNTIIRGTAEIAGDEIIVAGTISEGLYDGSINSFQEHFFSTEERFDNLSAAVDKLQLTEQQANYILDLSVENLRPYRGVIVKMLQKQVLAGSTQLRIFDVYGHDETVINLLEGLKNKSPLLVDKLNQVSDMENTKFKRDKALSAQKDQDMPRLKYLDKVMTPIPHALNTDLELLKRLKSFLKQ